MRTPIAAGRYLGPSLAVASRASCPDAYNARQRHSLVHEPSSLPHRPAAEHPAAGTDQWPKNRARELGPRRPTGIGRFAGIGTFAGRDRAAIRGYAAWFGFERVADALDCRTADYVAVYGSLRKYGGIGDEPDLSRRLKPAGTAVIEGKLVDLGDYPGLIPGAGKVQAELLEVVDREAFRIMDRHERYDPTDVQGSLYLRRAVRLLQPSADAWVYVYNRETGDAPEVPGGDWIGYVASRPTSERFSRVPR
jgi:gamma-glutamylcyclotransferase (GGCT)/AIG2-like uncharacterized protein YtfP